MAPKLLTPEQKESRLNICTDIQNNTDTDPGLLDTMTLKGTRFESVEAVGPKSTLTYSGLWREAEAIVGVDDTFFLPTSTDSNLFKI
ncbi:hypothetical protein NQ318_004703 [Aromia moschata]|uniref:Uncharacterized protein n=1 Tax=Aromia moschata TaxID=1265417 RepID=A0AAV8XI51_9CUCU|nr:hypothetical protein NQ318_004703 [Aromia moschata]